MESISSPGYFMYPGSGGGLVYKGYGRSIEFNETNRGLWVSSSAGELYFTCKNGVFGLSNDTEEACQFRLFMIPAIREPVTYRKAAALEKDGEYLIVSTDTNSGKSYALSYTGGSVTSAEVTVENSAVTVTADAPKWNYIVDTLAKGDNTVQADGWLRSVSSDTYYVIMFDATILGSGYSGYMVSALTLDYDADNYAIVYNVENGKLVGTFTDAATETKYYLTMTDGVFGATADEAEACAVDIYLKSEEGIEFHEVSSFEADGEYVILTESEGSAYALSYSSALGAEAVELEDDTVTVYNKEPQWKYVSGNLLQSVSSPTTYIFAGSSGLMTYSSGRTVDYINGKIYMHNKYYLTFVNGAFSQSKAVADACPVRIFKKSTSLCKGGYRIYSWKEVCPDRRGN
jgi:hypothetical protein